MMEENRISNDEQRVREQLAACYRLFYRYGWTDLIFTHLSARVPGHADQYVINPYGMLFNEVTASNLIKVSFKGEVISGLHSYNEAGHAIHSAVLKARPEINFVLHSHTRAGMAVSCMKCGLLPLTQQANEIRSLVSYHPYGGIPPEEPSECERIGKQLGDKWLMILQNHGLLSIGRSIGEAFYLHYYLENACKVQVDVLRSGVEYIQPNNHIIEKLAQHGEPPAEKPLQDTEILWEALIRSLDNDLSYKN